MQDQLRKLQRGFELAIHYVDVDKSTSGVAKPARKCPDELKSEIFPEAQCIFVACDDKVELHGAKAETFGFLEAMYSHRSPNSAATRRRRNHKAGVCHVRSEPGLISFENVSADYLLIR